MIDIILLVITMSMGVALADGTYDEDWTLLISDTPISCNGEPANGCTYYTRKTIYLSEWDPCIFWHEVQEHALQENNFNHHSVMCIINPDMIVSYMGYSN